MCCYFHDTYRKTQVFSYITRLISSSTLNEAEKIKFVKSVIENIEHLTEIDNYKAANLLLDYVHNEKEFDTILNSLEDKPKILYKLLCGLLLGRNGHKKDASINSVNFESLSVREQRKQTYVSNPIIQEKLITYMCQMEPHLVERSLISLDGYRIESVLQICKDHRINNATIYLLEKCGDYEQAFQLLFKEFDNTIKSIIESNIEESLIVIKDKLTLLIGFCQRCSSKIVESKDRETFWFALLESMLALTQIVKSLNKSDPMGNNYSNKLTELTDRLLNGMIGHIDLMKLLQRIINDPLYSGECVSSENLCDIKELLMGMLDSYNYQETLYKTTNNLLLKELHQQLSNFRKYTNKAQSNRSLLCSICLKPLSLDVNVILFKCQHSYHERCLKEKTTNYKLCVMCELKNADLNHTSMQVNVDMTAKEANHFDMKQPLIKLDDSQLSALEHLKNSQRIDLRVHILNQLPNTRINLSTKKLQNDSMYKLNLAPHWKPISN